MSVRPAAKTASGSSSAPARTASRRDSVAVLVVLTALSGALGVAALGHVSFAPANKQSVDTFDQVVLHQSAGGQVSFEIGIALRQDVGSRLEDLRIPALRHIIPVDKYKRDVISRPLLRLMLRGRVTMMDYDPRVTDERLKWMLSKYKTRSLGRWGPVYILEGTASTRYVVRTNAASSAVYVVPAEVDAKLGPWPGKPLPPDEGQPTDDAEVP